MAACGRPPHLDWLPVPRPHAQDGVFPLSRTCIQLPPRPHRPCKGLLSEWRLGILIELPEAA